MCAELLYFLFRSLQLFSRIVFVEERAQPLNLLTERLDRDNPVVEPLLYQEFTVTLFRQLLAYRVQLVSQTGLLCHYFFYSRPHIVNRDFEGAFVRFQLGDLVNNIDRQLRRMAANADRNGAVHLQLLLRRRRTLDRVYISRLECIPCLHGVQQQVQLPHLLGEPRVFLVKLHKSICLCHATSSHLVKLCLEVIDLTRQLIVLTNQLCDIVSQYPLLLLQFSLGVLQLGFVILEALVLNGQLFDLLSQAFEIDLVQLFVVFQLLV